MKHTRMYFLLCLLATHSAFGCLSKEEKSSKKKQPVELSFSVSPTDHNNNQIKGSPIQAQSGSPKKTPRKRTPKNKPAFLNIPNSPARGIYMLLTPNHRTPGSTPSQNFRQMPSGSIDTNNALGRMRQIESGKTTTLITAIQLQVPFDEAIKCIDAESVNKKDMHGKTALYYAIHNKAFGVMHMLLKANANPDIGCNDFYPLLAAIKTRDAEIVHSLIKAKASVIIPNIDLVKYAHNHKVTDNRLLRLLKGQLGLQKQFVPAAKTRTKSFASSTVSPQSSAENSPSKSPSSEISNETPTEEETFVE